MTAFFFRNVYSCVFCHCQKALNKLQSKYSMYLNQSERKMQFEDKQCVKLILHLTQINKRLVNFWGKKQE